VTPTELDQYLVEHAISDTEHLTLLNLAPVDLFSKGFCRSKAQGAG
jgi:hypothetical protein